MVCHNEHTMRMTKRAWIVVNRFNEAICDTDDYSKAQSIAKTMSCTKDVHGEVLKVVSNSEYFREK